MKDKKRTYRENVIEFGCKASHVLVGLVAGLISPLNPAGAVLLIWLFIRYQVNEQKSLRRDKKIIDPSYQEFRECLVGLVIGATVSTILLGWLIYRLSVH